jgi:FecR protein/Putative zinc-finger
MLCSKFEKRIVAAVDDGFLLESDKRLKVHLDQCPECRALLEELKRENEFLVDAGAAFALPSGIDDRIIANLPTTVTKISTIPYRYLAYAVAACVLVLLTVLIYPNSNVAKVANLEGTIQVKTITGWKDLEEGSSIRDKAVLRTLEGSQARIVFEEGNYIRFEPESSIYLGARVHKQYDHIYRLEYGSIWAKVAHNYNGQFYIETPNALVIRVLGTEFNVRAVPDTEQ